jgi:hypothetical protein
MDSLGVAYGSFMSSGLVLDMPLFAVACFVWLPAGEV